MTCFWCITETTIIYSVHEHDLASSSLCNANHNHGYILITLMGSVATNSSVSSEAKIESMEEYSEAS